MSDQYTWTSFSADYRKKHNKATIKEVAAAWRKYKQDNGIEIEKGTILEPVVYDVDESQIKPISRRKPKPEGKLKAKIAAPASPVNKRAHAYQTTPPLIKKPPPKIRGDVTVVRAVGNRKTIEYNCDEFPSIEEVVSAAIRLLDIEFVENGKNANVTSLWLNKKYEMRPSNYKLVDEDFNAFLHRSRAVGEGPTGKFYIDVQVIIRVTKEGYEISSVTYGWTHGLYQVPIANNYTVNRSDEGVFDEAELYQELLSIYNNFVSIDVNVLIEALDVRKACPKDKILSIVGEYILDTYEKYVHATGGNKFPWVNNYFTTFSKNGPWMKEVRKFWEDEYEEALGLYLGYRSILYIDNALRGGYNTVVYPTFSEFFPKREVYVYALKDVSILVDLPTYIGDYEQTKKKVITPTPRDPSGKLIYRAVVPPKPLPPLPTAKKPAAATTVATRSPPKFKPRTITPQEQKPAAPKQQKLPVTTTTTTTISTNNPNNRVKTPTPRKSPAKNNTKKPDLDKCGRDMEMDDFIKGIKYRLDRLLDIGRTSTIKVAGKEKVVSKVFTFCRNKNYPIDVDDDDFKEQIKKGIPKSNRDDETLSSLDTYAVIMKEKKKDANEEDRYFCNRAFLFVPSDTDIPITKFPPYFYDVDVEKEFIEKDADELNGYNEEQIDTILKTIFDEAEFVDFWTYRNAWDYYWTGKCNENVFGKEVGMVKKMIFDSLPNKEWVEDLLNDKVSYKDKLPVEDESNEGEFAYDYRVLLYLLGAAQGEPQKYRFGVSKDPIIKSTEDFYKNPTAALDLIRTKFRELFNNASKKNMTNNKPNALANALRKPPGGFPARKVLG